MGETELRRQVLALLHTAAAHHERLGAVQLVADAKKHWNADEFAVREAIWYLLTTDQIELTAERTLQPVAHVGEPVMA